MARFDLIIRSVCANKTMKLTAIDRERIRKMRETLERPHFPRWNKDVVRQINVSDGTTLGAIERGRKLDLGLRTGQIELTQESFDKAGLQIPLGLGKKYLELSTHRATCEKAPLYRDQRRYGTRKGEQTIVDEIRKLAAEGKSFRDIAETLNADGTLPREGKWHHTKISRILEHAEHGVKPQPCTCRMFRNDWVPPRKWSICWEILQLTDRTFEAMRKSVDGNFYDITIHDIRLFRRSRFFQPPPARQVAPRPTGPFINRIILGDCLDVLLQLPTGSVSCVVTSPPYGNSENNTLENAKWTTQNGRLSGWRRSGQR